MALDLRTAKWAEIEAAWEAAPPLTLETFQKLVNLTPERVVVELLCEAPQYDRIEERAQRGGGRTLLTSTGQDTKRPTPATSSWPPPGTRGALTIRGA